MYSVIRRRTGSPRGRCKLICRVFRGIKLKSLLDRAGGIRSREEDKRTEKGRKKQLITKKTSRDNDVTLENKNGVETAATTMRKKKTKPRKPAGAGRDKKEELDLPQF